MYQRYREDPDHLAEEVRHLNHQRKTLQNTLQGTENLTPLTPSLQSNQLICKDKGLCPYILCVGTPTSYNTVIL